MILALKTAGDTTQLALYRPGKLIEPIAKIEWQSGRQLADELLAKLQAFLDDQPKAEPALTGIIIFSGPGSFTSLRIGHTVANALADSLGIPVAGGVGESWVEAALSALATAKSDVIVLPHYGAEANITKPKP